MVPEQKLLALQVELASSDKGDIHGEIFCTKTFVRDNIESEYEFKDPIALKASADPDTIIYLHKTMKEDGRRHFITAIQKEVQDQMDSGNFTIVKTSEVPND